MRVVLAALTVLAVGCGGAESSVTTTTLSPPTTTGGSPTTGGSRVEFVDDERPARLVIPPTWQPRGAPMPVVVLLHGYGASGEIQDVYLGVSVTGADLGYLALTPDGTPDTRGNRFWNASNLDGFVDDTGYIVGLIDQVVADFNGDPDRVYLVGHSNGGFMANKVACEFSDRIAGIAAIAGGIFGTSSTCRGPVQVIVIQGTEDETVPYEGGAFLGAPVLGAEETVARWLEAGGCAAGSTQEGPFNFDLLVPGDETTVTAWNDCAAGASVELWRMEGSGHVPGFLPDFRSSVMERLLGFEGR